jgi:hypothetical protein
MIMLQGDGSTKGCSVKLDLVQLSPAREGVQELKRVFKALVSVVRVYFLKRHDDLQLPPAFSFQQ